MKQIAITGHILSVLIKLAVLLSGLLLSAELLSQPRELDPLVKVHRDNHACGSGVSLVITDADRFDPLVQQLLLKQQLAGHPVIDRPRFVVIPAHDDDALTEAQIRYLERLLSKASSGQVKAAD